MTPSGDEGVPRQDPLPQDPAVGAPRRAQLPRGPRGDSRGGGRARHTDARPRTGDAHDSDRPHGAYVRRPFVQVHLVRRHRRRQGEPTDDMPEIWAVICPRCMPAHTGDGPQVRGPPPSLVADSGVPFTNATRALVFGLQHRAVQACAGCTADHRVPVITLRVPGYACRTCSTLTTAASGPRPPSLA